MIFQIKKYLAIILISLGLTIIFGCIQSSESQSEAISTQTPAIAELSSNSNAPRFGIPIDCSLGKDCFIIHYVDQDPESGEVDFGCGRQTYDGHKGTDFGIADLRVMKTGVAVTATADGTVLRVRDGIVDQLVEDQTDKRSVEGTECGNGIVIDHGNGWETQYCHLRNGSIAVKPGNSVKKGTVLGMVGASGLASFPHVHLTIRYQGEVVAPFVGVNAASGCNVTRNALWDQSLDYVPTGLIRAGFASKPPNLGELWRGEYSDTRLSQSIPALVFWVQSYGVL
ncbi:MAG: M23 family metallopeptidase [Moorea sp. SIO2B7]|nr:M23 family metallopeptidase [Moorena sp. SIO2B7]